MTEYNKLKAIINEADLLIGLDVSASDERFQAWKMKVSRFLIKNFGSKSHEYDYFQKTQFSLYVISSSTPDSAFIEACAQGLRKTKAVLMTYLEDLEDEINTAATIVTPNENFSKVFIVHGHDGELKESVARLVEKQGIKAIILSNQANQGKTIIEKLETHSDVSGAICLFTPDDIGNAKDEEIPNYRARQNVVLETGYFMAKLGRDRVVIIAEKEVELPSDMSGVLYVEKTEWRFSVLKELKSMGYNIDYNKLD